MADPTKLFLSTLAIRNFKSIGQQGVHIEISARRGLTGVLGANGSGWLLSRPAAIWEISTRMPPGAAAMYRCLLHCLLHRDYKSLRLCLARRKERVHGSSGVCLRCGSKRAARAVPARAHTWRSLP